MLCDAATLQRSSVRLVWRKRVFVADELESDLMNTSLNPPFMFSETTNWCWCCGRCQPFGPMEILCHFIWMWIERIFVASKRCCCCRCCARVFIERCWCECNHWKSTYEKTNLADATVWWKLNWIIASAGDSDRDDNGDHSSALYMYIDLLILWSNNDPFALRAQWMAINELPAISANETFDKLSRMPQWRGGERLLN